MALTYFQSHGPATLKDFVWWSGLTAKAAKAGLANSRHQLESEILEGEEYWFPEPQELPDSNTYLLPAYDEFVIGYKDKTFSLSDQNYRKRVQVGGVFRPIVVVDG